MPTLILVDFASWFLFSIPASIFGGTKIVIMALCHFLSLKSNLKMLFAPWKNERRKGYVSIARGIGFMIRSFTVSVNLLLIILTVVIGAGLVIIWFSLPLIILLI